MMALMTVSNGITVLTETVFENRFKHVDELEGWVLILKSMEIQQLLRE